MVPLLHQIYALNLWYSLSYTSVKVMYPVFYICVIRLHEIEIEESNASYKRVLSKAQSHVDLT